MDTDEINNSIITAVDSHRSQLIDLCLKIHANPELGLHEEKADE